MDSDRLDERVADIIAQLEEVLSKLDGLNAKIPAIRVDEAISTLCEIYHVERSCQNYHDL